MESVWETTSCKRGQKSRAFVCDGIIVRSCDLTFVSCDLCVVSCDPVMCQVQGAVDAEVKRVTCMLCHVTSRLSCTCHDLRSAVTCDLCVVSCDLCGVLCDL